MPRESSKYDNTVVNRHSEAMAHLIDLFVYKGQPRNLDPDREVQILVNHGFVVGFSPNRNQPVWAGYRVAKAIEDVNYARPHLFYDDYRLPPYNQIGYKT
jgi:endonuclease G